MANLGPHATLFSTQLAAALSGFLDTHEMIVSISLMIRARSTVGTASVDDPAPAGQVTDGLAPRQ
jgi:hypothetical protein